MTGATSKRSDPQWRVFPDSETLAARLAEEILGEAQASIERRGRFLIVLAGGATPGRVYEKLAQAQADWRRWQVWFGDERCYPAGHAERNDTLARAALLDRVPIPSRNLHAVSAAGWGPEAAARRYAQTLPVDLFDLTLLGLGEDGHTASLFPGQDWGTGSQSADVLAVRHAPKPPADRVSLSAHRLSRSRRVIFIVTGAGKCDAATRWKNGAPIPAAAVQAPHLEVWLDQAAVDS